jgi:hypothetical protein
MLSNLLSAPNFQQSAVILHWLHTLQINMFSKLFIFHDKSPHLLANFSVLIIFNTEIRHPGVTPDAKGNSVNIYLLKTAA